MVEHLQLLVKDLLGQKNLPYNYSVVKEIIFNDAKLCATTEEQLISKYKIYKYKPLNKFVGSEECFLPTVKKELLEDVINV